MMSFNLTTEKWIPVICQDWTIKEVSLIELFQNWQSYREIKADNPPTTLALYRFLLAILHRAYMGPKDVDHWEEIQEDNGKAVIEYLQNYADCFDLFHPEKPFMQDLTLTEDLANQSYALHIMQGGNTSTVFSHEHEWSGYSISIPEVTRLLIRLQTIEISSPRANYPAPNVGVKNTKATAMINVPNIIIKGENLKETLLLNLMQYDPDSEIPCVPSGEDIPTWEKGYNGTPKVGKKAKSPQGYIHYLTYPWRRLRIFININNDISQIAITKGDEFPDQISESIWECHIPFNKDKKALRLFTNKQLWRDSYSFLQTSEKYNRPRIMDWVAELYREELISNIIHLQVFGMCADKAKPEAWSFDNFSAPIDYILDQSLGNTLNIAIQIAEEYQQVFRSFKGSPYHALDEALKHGDAKSLANSLDGESRYWLILDHEFTKLLDALPKDKRIEGENIHYGDQELPKWTETVKKAARDAFTESIQSIRNYEARAKALQRLNYQLKKIEGNDDEKPKKSKKSRKKG